MSKYRNTRTGRVVDLPDEPTTRTRRRGRNKQWAQKLTRMARSKRWERVSDSARVGMPTTRPKKGKKARKTEAPAAARKGPETPDSGQEPTGQDEGQKDA